MKCLPDTMGPIMYPAEIPNVIADIPSAMFELSQFSFNIERESGNTPKAKKYVLVIYLT